MCKKIMKAWQIRQKKESWINQRKNNQEEVLSEDDSMVLPNKSRYNKEKNNELYELEIEEKKIALRERSMKLRADEAEIRIKEAEALELENLKNERIIICLNQKYIH